MGRLKIQVLMAPGVASLAEAEALSGISAGFGPDRQGQRPERSADLPEPDVIDAETAVEPVRRGVAPLRTSRRRARNPVQFIS